MKKSLQIRMADLRIRIYYQYDYLAGQCGAWIDTSEAAPDIEVEASAGDVEKEYQEFSQGSVTRAMCESVCIYREIAGQLGKFSAFVMHGAAIELDGRAYIFGAKSGVGKTTHTKLWLERFPGRADYINGDKPVIRYRDGQWYAYGTPWMGKERYGAPKCAPVQAVCFIERGEVNKIREIEDKEIVNRLFHQLYLPQEQETMLQFMGLVDRMVKELPFYVLQCNISAEAAETAYQAMKNAKKRNGKRNWRQGYEN